MSGYSATQDRADALSPFAIGSLALESPIIHSPLAGCSDVSFRKMCRKYSKALLYCEMVRMEALLSHRMSTYGLLAYSEEMHPIGAQIVGSSPRLAGPAAKIIEDLGFDVVDLNCGCPVDKVTRDGSGSGMLRDPERIGEVLANMVAAVKIPVTVKIRAGWTEGEINASEIASIARDAGAALIAIHGRTRAQGYKGKADRDVIREVKQQVSGILVAGNGDIFAPPSALHMFEHTGCDAIVISRGVMGQPWLASDLAAALQGLSHSERGPKEALDALLEHLRLIDAHQNEKRAKLDARRVCCWYCKAAPSISSLRSTLARASSLSEATLAVRAFRARLDRVSPCKLSLVCDT